MSVEVSMEVKELSKFQKDIVDRAARTAYKLLVVKTMLNDCIAELAQMFDACPWLDPNQIDEHAKKRLAHDHDVPPGPSVG